MATCKTRRRKIVSCSKHTRKHKQCVRKRDGKVFTLPRKWSRVQCRRSKIKGFTMKSSCAPYKI